MFIKEASESEPGQTRIQYTKVVEYIRESQIHA